jgi:hypothetical protein
LADFLDIESLQKLALQKFNRLIHNSFPPKGYVEAAQEAFANIGPTDIALKKSTLQQYLVHPTEIAEKREPNHDPERIRASCMDHVARS